MRTKEELYKIIDTGKAIFKYNGGAGALLCSCCSVIIKTGGYMTTEEVLAMTGAGKSLPPQFCDTCKPIIAEYEEERFRAINGLDDESTGENQSAPQKSQDPPPPPAKKAVKCKGTLDVPKLSN